MLKLLEGAKVSVPHKGGRKHPEQKMIQIDTKNILFICGGAFDGISKIIEESENQSMGLILFQVKNLMMKKCCLMLIN